MCVCTPFLVVYAFLQAHVSLADLGRQHTLELDENSSTFLPAMPLISRIRQQKITALPQTAFVPTFVPSFASTKLPTAAAHIVCDKQGGWAAEGGGET